MDANFGFNSKESVSMLVRGDKERNRNVSKHQITTDGFYCNSLCCKQLSKLQHPSRVDSTMCLGCDSVLFFSPLPNISLPPPMKEW